MINITIAPLNYIEKKINSLTNEYTPNLIYRMIIKTIHTQVQNLRSLVKLFIHGIS